MVENRKLIFWMVIGILILTALACNLPTMANNPDSDTAENVDPADEANGNLINNPPEQSSPSEEEIQIEDSALPDFDLSDPCSIVPVAVVETILGIPVDPVPGPGVCVYSTGMVSISVAILQGEASKLGMINEILQLENGCSMSYSYSSDQPDPTPIPASAAYLLEMTTQELMEKSLDLQETCGGPIVETLDQYGPGVFLMPFELFMPGGLVSIAGEDYSLTILYVDMEQDASASVEVARELLEMIVAGK